MTNQTKADIEGLCAYGSNGKIGTWYQIADCSQKFLKKANNRSLWDDEIVLDDDDDRLIEIEELLRKEDIKYLLYKSGSKGFHFHLFFPDLAKLNWEEKKATRLAVIQYFGCDPAKMNGMIAWENRPHFKTGQLKTLLDENVDVEEILKGQPLPEMFKNIKIIEIKNLNMAGFKPGTKIQCPWHKNGKETNPSLLINKDGTFHCFGCVPTRHESLEILKEKLENVEIEQYKKDIIPTLKNIDLHQEMMTELDKVVVNEENLKKYLLNFCLKSLVINVQDYCGALINDSSSKGKSFCSTRIVEIFPKLNRFLFTKITPEALTYWHENDKKFTYNGKILYFEDIRQNVLESETLKTFITDKSTALVTRKQKAVEIKIPGKPVIIITSCNADFGEEMLNRMEIARLSNDKNQSKSILSYQLQKSLGQTEEINPDVIKKLECLERVNVSLEQLENELKLIQHQYLSVSNSNVRRDFPRFLDKIKASTALHQYNRERNTNDYVVAIKDDLEMAMDIQNTLYLDATFAKLTHNEERTLQTIKEWTEKNPNYYTMYIDEGDTSEWCSRGDIHAAKPFATFMMIGEYMDSLVNKGLLKCEPKRIGDNRKPSHMYKLVQTSKRFRLEV